MCKRCIVKDIEKDKIVDIFDKKMKLFVNTLTK
jgi:hypothetical protein